MAWAKNFNAVSHNRTWPEVLFRVVDTQTTLHVIAKINGVQARIMLDSGAGSSYISSNLLIELNLKPYKTERRICSVVTSVNHTSTQSREITHASCSSCENGVNKLELSFDAW